MQMHKLCLIVLLFIISSFDGSYAQDNKTQDCFYTREKALLDIKQNTARILVQGGIAPITYTSDKGFFEKYKISYYVFGCVAPEDVKCLNAYNSTIFDHLDKTFGKGWRKDVRKDAIGLRL